MPDPDDAHERRSPDARSWLHLVVLVAAGAAVGATLRYGLGGGLPHLVGTLAANAAGSVLLGALLARPWLGGSRELRLLVGTGALSSFTTYSTFALEAATASLPTAAGYVAATYALGLAGVVVGQRAARGLPGGGG